ncbi:hypothetical protein PIB30_012709 [Stylosanthes scabra]|uniref:very-long-chain 3-oxoacyl-CoA synthase n=1 Tax=Stylosanthes scabra TaxID=79078 RepID=A0ABU6R6S7_9FABA|nr:hypothetical protein [Stylosanthes scabra]
MGMNVTANPMISGLQYWLVYHPTILNFQWDPPQTPFSSTMFLSAAVLSYLSLTLILSLLPLPPLSPNLLKPLTALHNLILLILSLAMSLGCALTVLSHSPHLNWAICFPPNTRPNGPLFFWAYIFYLSKILEFLDTLFIVLSRSFARLTFLHVYHHATVLVMCYLWLHTSQLFNLHSHVVLCPYLRQLHLASRPTASRSVRPGVCAAHLVGSSTHLRPPTLSLFYLRGKRFSFWVSLSLKLKTV